MTDYKSIIAYNIIELRKTLGLTQADLAEKLNYSDKAVSKWESGKSLPDVTVLAQIADMAGVPLDYMIREHLDAAPVIPGDTHKRRNRVIVSLLSVALLWLIATITAVVLTQTGVGDGTWRYVVLGAVIGSEIILLIFNSIWGKNKLNYLTVTFMIWSVLLLLNMVFSFRYTQIFLVGIPGQLIVILWSMLSFRKYKTKKKDPES